MISYTCAVSPSPPGSDPDATATGSADGNGSNGGNGSARIGRSAPNAVKASGGGPKRPPRPDHLDDHLDEHLDEHHPVEANASEPDASEASVAAGRGRGAGPRNRAGLGAASSVPAARGGRPPVRTRRPVASPDDSAELLLRWDGDPTVVAPSQPGAGIGAAALPPAPTPLASELIETARSEPPRAGTGESGRDRRVDADDGRRRGRRVRRVVRRIDLWSVLKLAMVLYTCLYVAVLATLALVWSIAYSSGQIDKVQSFLADVGLENYRFYGDQMFRACAAIGAIGVLTATIITVLTAALVNVVSEITGGIRLVVIEEEPAPRRRPS